MQQCTPGLDGRQREYLNGKSWNVAWQITPLIGRENAPMKVAFGTYFTLSRLLAEGNSECMSSFRSESYGMFSATAFITGMNKYLDMPLEFYLDNDALIKRIVSSRFV